MGQSSYIPSLDGWRAVSIIGVVLFHGHFFRSDSFIAKLTFRGYLGVDVFFALSGFLICGLLLQEYGRDGDIDLRGFYIRRAFRILPPYYLALLGLCLLSVIGAVQINYSNLPSCLLFYRNYRPLGGTNCLTAHYWSLAVEEHFYLFWPPLLVAVKPKRIGRVALVLAVAVFCWRVLEMRFNFLPSVLPAGDVMCRTDTRVDALFWGCLAAIYFPAIKRLVERVSFSQLWLPILAVLLATQAIRTPSLMLQGILLPALVLSTVLQPASWLGRVLELKPIRWIGRLSYSLYLWQQPFLCRGTGMQESAAFRHLQQPPWSVLAILACACLSRYLIEIPATRMGHRLAKLPFVLTRPSPLIPGAHSLTP